MKKISFFILLILSLFGCSGKIYAEIPKFTDPNLNKIIVLPSVTPTPTSSIKFIPPFKEFKPLVTAGVSPTVSQITPTPTGPLISPSPEATAGITIETKVNPQTEDATGTSQKEEQNENEAISTKDIVILVLAAVVLALLVISQWPKIKIWIHRKTE